jgi:hypothetical protein
MANGARFTHVVIDEYGSTEPRRALIVARADGSTYSADVPESLDLGQVIERGETVAADVPRS